ncbi:hypothetical protein [Nocardiopsis sp. CNS-639]|uniref:hypothetical protein n=1 Tax=Nocardiopsis sp. CNS-639 TaxID=1169153 RepID=UPI000368D1BF|nr:hypothetical protein [Nocardiopsis sp. CNS-639]
MHLISPLYTASSVISLLFEVLYLLFGVLMLALSGVVASGRRGLVATGGALIVLSALGDLAVQIWSFTPMYAGMDIAVHTTVLPALYLMFTLLFVGGLLALVLAAAKRLTAPTTAPPPPPGHHPGPRPFPTR